MYIFIGFKIYYYLKNYKSFLNQIIILFHKDYISNQKLSKPELFSSNSIYYSDWYSFINKAKLKNAFVMLKKMLIMKISK